MSCSVCKSSKQEIVLDLGAIPLCDDISDTLSEARITPSYEVRILRCDACDHCELEHKPPEDYIYSTYTYRTSLSPTLNEHFSLYASSLIAEYINKPTNDHGVNFVDIGGNDGVLANIMRLKGFNTSVIDPSPSAIYCNENIYVYNEYLTEELVQRYLQENGKAHLVTCNNCIANIRDLKGFALCLSTLLDDDGLLCIETGYIQNQLQSRTLEMINHEHYHYFSIHSLRKLFRQCGLHMVRFEFINTKGGSLRFYARKGIASDCDKSAAPVEILNIDKFNSYMTHRRIELSKLIQDKKVDFFGASAGTTILAYFFRLESFVRVVVDDNESRHQKFMPGTGAKIISPKEWYENPGEYCINFAWRFGNLIRSRHAHNLPQDYLIIDIIE